ncbi:MAG: hypothetical protein QXG38_03280 [Candidatus Hadarchaeales archaeon]
MWLITTLIAAIIATTAKFLSQPKYRLGLLSLMFWGATVMILVDHVLGYEGGEFLDASLEALGIGIAMIIPVLVIWGIAVLRSR